MLELPRFHLLEPHKLEELLFSRKADYTNRVSKSAEDLFREFLCANGLSIHFFNGNDYLDNVLKESYLIIKRKDGKRYKTKSLQTLKDGIKQFIMQE